MPAVVPERITAMTPLREPITTWSEAAAALRGVMSRRIAANTWLRWLGAPDRAIAVVFYSTPIIVYCGGVNGRGTSRYILNCGNHVTASTLRRYKLCLPSDLVPTLTGGAFQWPVRPGWRYRGSTALFRAYFMTDSVVIHEPGDA